MKRVIYTAITGGYDSICQPSIVREDFDYILYTDDVREKQIGVWQVHKIPYTNKDNIRIARWVKTHPHLLLEDYAYSIWIDSNVIIKSENVYNHADELYKKGILISSMSHPERNCIYDECLEVAVKNRDSLHRILPELLFLKKQKYPPQYGLCETNFVFRNHQDTIVHKICEDWWYMIDTYSRRDQLSFNYTLWSNQLPVDLFLGKDFCTRNHPYFECHMHKDILYEYKTWLRFLKVHALQIYTPAFKSILHCQEGCLKEIFAVQYLYMMELFLHRVHKIFCNRKLRNTFTSIKNKLSGVNEN